VQHISNPHPHYRTSALNENDDLRFPDSVEHHKVANLLVRSFR
jgi:hypothetical protein